MPRLLQNGVLWSSHWARIDQFIQPMPSPALLDLVSQSAENSDTVSRYSRPDPKTGEWPLGKVICFGDPGDWLFVADRKILLASLPKAVDEAFSRLNLQASDFRCRLWITNRVPYTTLIDLIKPTTKRARFICELKYGQINLANMVKAFAFTRLDNL